MATPAEVVDERRKLEAIQRDFAARDLQTGATHFRTNLQTLDGIKPPVVDNDMNAILMRLNEQVAYHHDTLAKVADAINLMSKTLKANEEEREDINKRITTVQTELSTRITTVQTEMSKQVLASVDAMKQMYMEVIKRIDEHDKKIAEITAENKKIIDRLDVNEKKIDALAGMIKTTNDLAESTKRTTEELKRDQERIERESRERRSKREENSGIDFSGFYNAILLQSIFSQPSGGTCFAK